MSATNTKDKDASSLASIYRRIKLNCCDDWRTDASNFYKWYLSQSEKQKGSCIYCYLPGNTTEAYGKQFRGGRRGKRLEVDRIESKEPYSPANCVLACYPCNNAKSDVFSYKEFIEIGKAIRRVKSPS
jgi:hypothetical protein